MSGLSLENILTDAEAIQDKNQIHKTLLVKNKCSILKAKQGELDQWKKGGTRNILMKDKTVFP